MKNPLIKKNILIHFGDADPQGIMYHSRVYDIAHSLLEEFWAARPEGWAHWFQNQDWAVPLRHSECDFLAPLHVGKSYTSTLNVTEIGDSSVAFVCEITDASGSVCARAKTVHVFVDRKSFKKINVPAGITAILR